MVGPIYFWANRALNIVGDKNGWTMVEFFFFLLLLGGILILVYKGNEQGEREGESSPIFLLSTRHTTIIQKRQRQEIQALYSLYSPHTKNITKKNYKVKG